MWDSLQPHVDTYYSEISDDLTGDALLSALRSLNSKRKKSSVDYDDMGTTASGQFKYTDYTLDSVKYDSNNQPYGISITSFYSGNTTKSFNREHVWPKSHGGNVVENDIHMVRPTISSENGSRGNSFYVEGKKSTSDGWDPAMESFGEETYRGDSARIIFYCVVANSKLSLVDLEKHTTSNANPDYLMGKITDMLKWNLNYEVQDREQRRNEGAEYLQGNRNPFIDHPEYACKIWGNYNSDTKTICAKQLGPSVSVSTIELTIEEESTDTLSAVSSDDSLITWSTSDSNIVSLSATTSPSGTKINLTAVAPGTATVTAKATIEEVEYTSSCEVTVTAKPIPVLTSISLSGTQPRSFYVNDTFSYEGLIVTANYSVGASKQVTDYLVFPPDMSTIGTKTVTVTYVEDGVSKSAYYTVTISSPLNPTRVESVQLSTHKVTMKPDDTYHLGYTINPSDAYNQKVTWSSDNPGIANVALDGTIYSYRNGKCTITITTEDGGFTDTCLVIVSSDTQQNAGCSGNVISSSIILSTLSICGIGLLLLKRKFIK